MKILLSVIAMAIGMPVAVIAVFLIAYFGEFPLPVSSSQFRTDWKFKTLVTQGDQIIGGGYSFAEARDIWIRLRLHHEPDLTVQSVAETCSPEALEKIRTWFLKQATPQKILGILPLSDDSHADEVVLNDVANLRCKSTESYTPITHQLGEFPQGCSMGWILYHKPSRFYYERSPCSH
ncbi:MAG: hypothetical protein KME27_04750 [Lyngbya sp. HA4199-MV5]|jgi:hypothetical protein|nr:hypothetical protein [Lyngbya sp. HA4199-MV5]